MKPLFCKSGISASLEWMKKPGWTLWVQLLIMVMGSGMVRGNEIKAVEPLPPMEHLQQMLEQRNEIDRELKRLSEMILIPAGEYTMGSDSGEKNERPAHQVYLDAYFIDKYEVTQLQYLEVMETNPSYFNKCSLCPVEKVTFYEALEYCQKNKKRLPTEAEWEKAARGGTTGPYYWPAGKAPEGFAWHGNNASRQTHPVGQKQANSFGLHDIAGNVWEWVNDWYRGSYYKTSPKKNPSGPERGVLKVIRGGAWGHPPEFLRHSLRGGKEPDTRNINGGFRCASDAL